MTALERLESLLDEKDRRIAELEERMRELTDESDRTWDWARHQLLEDDSALPVPRLEIRCRNLGDWWNWEWLYGIVYRRLTGTIVFVPLGHTKVGTDRFATKTAFFFLVHDASLSGSMDKLFTML